MPSIILQWTELNPDRGLHQTHIAKGPDGTVYRISPIHYRGGKFAGYQVTIGNVRQRGWKTMLHEAKARAQRHANTKRNAAVNVSRSRGKRVLDLDDVRRIEVTIPGHKFRMIDLD